MSLDLGGTKNGGMDLREAGKWLELAGKRATYEDLQIIQGVTDCPAMEAEEKIWPAEEK